MIARAERSRYVLPSSRGKGNTGNSALSYVVPAQVQRCEVRDAVGAEDDRLAIEHEMLLVQFQRGRDYEREAPSPIMPALLIKRTRSCSRMSIIR